MSCFKPEENELNQEHSWELINSYFENKHLHQLVKHQIESYNDFIIKNEADEDGTVLRNAGCILLPSSHNNSDELQRQQPCTVKIICSETDE